MKLRWASNGGGHFNASRIRLRSFPLHTHDFAEVFWIAEGRATHTVNGRRMPLREGMLTLIRPRDEHGLSAGRDGFVLCNVAFPAAVLRNLRKSYIPDDANFWGGTREMPWQTTLSALQMRGVNSGFEELARGSRQPWAIMRFLLNLLHALDAAPEGFEYRGLPDWLQRACRDIRHPRNFAGGTVQFARLAGRCPEHVAREMRRLTRRSPTDVVNEARMRHAASQLLLSDKTILDIALECGFQSVGHFYKTFQGTYNTTPRAYRHRTPMTVGAASVS